MTDLKAIELTHEEFQMLVGMLGRNISIKRCVELTSSNPNDVAFYLYTEKHKYHVRANFEAGWFSSGLSNRAPEPGETHTRGSDLPDGKLTMHTWLRFLSAVVAFELVPLHDSIAVQTSQDPLKEWEYY